MTTELQSVFRRFSDVATEPQFATSSGGLRVQLVRHGEPRDYLVDTKTSEITARHDQNRRYPHLNALLASEEFACLEALASTQVRLLDPVVADGYMEPNVLVNETTELDDSDGFMRTVEQAAPAKLHITLLDGSAGIGKTHLLRRITWKRAKEVLDGVNAPPVLHIQSRGRRFTGDLETLFAADKDRVGGRFNFRQLPILVRRGLLILALDGFDELTDSDGYKDAWFGLRGFLKQLGPEGSLILAGRDTFFDQQRFRERLEHQQRGSVSLTLARIRLPRPEQAMSWLRQKGWSPSDVASEPIQQLLASDRYTLRPFFLNRLAEQKDLASWSPQTKGKSPRSVLLERVLAREAKLNAKGALTEGVLLAGLRYTFGEIAYDMVERESDEVESQFVQILLQSFLEDNDVPEEATRRMMHRSGSLALLEPGSRPEFVRLPHSEVVYYFLASRVLQDLSSKEIPLVLRRGVLGRDFIAVWQDTLEEHSTQTVRAALDCLARRIATEFSADRLEWNGAALLVGALTRQLHSQRREYHDLNMNDCALTGSVQPAKLARVGFALLDVVGADLTSVEFEDVSVGTLVVDSLTQFGKTTPRVDIIRVDELRSSKTLRAPLELAGWFESHSEQAPHPIDGAPSEWERFFERLCRACIRQFYIRDSEDDTAGALLQDDKWPIIQGILDDEDHLTVKVDRAMGGTPDPLYHIKDARALVERSTDDARRIWSRISQLN